VRILVTGGAGFIGSHVVEAFLAEGHEVAVVDNLSTGRREHVDPRAAFHACDILSPAFQEVVQSFRPEAVAHLAAQSSVKLSTADPVGDLNANGAATLVAALAAARNGARRFIYSSTGGMLYGEPEALPVREDHPLRATSAYGVSKRVGELYVDWVARSHGLEAVVLRYANVYGPRQDPNGEAGVVAIFTGRMLAGEPCTIDGDGEQQKDYVYVCDIARANVLALTKGGGESLNIGTGRGTSVNRIFGELQRATGDSTPPRHGPPREGDVRRVWLESSRARDVLGWEPQVSFEEGIARTVAWFRARHA
jgi:UDP-glucose 4-epimerase